MQETVLSILGQYVLSPLLALIGGYFVGRRKDRAEAKKIDAQATSEEATASGVELNNVEKALAIYRGIVNDLGGNIRDLEQRVVTLQQTIKTLEGSVHTLENENKDLKKRLRKYESS